ncbi:MAG: SRPBCC domain-containing protein [Planctomycetes bacterium]|nr:SRPBCC domain-containing protein [Planctomycetota bacterium]MBI3845597.1 SRPBCC domain-containing protein [Planctomycetota bacterium]
MTPTIRQTVTLPAPPEQLYAMYMDPKTHAAFTGGRVTISAKPGSKFSAFGGAIGGTTVCAVPGRMVVQLWKSTYWRRSDLDSVLILTFSKARGGGRIDLVHVNVAPQDHRGVTKGWKNYYWKPWRQYLVAAKKSKRPRRSRA